MTLHQYLTKYVPVLCLEGQFREKLHEVGYSKRRVVKTLGIREYNKKMR